MLDNLVDEFDLQISECSYDKIWAELSDRDKDVLYYIAEEGITSATSKCSIFNVFYAIITEFTIFISRNMHEFTLFIFLVIR